MPFFLVSHTSLVEADDAEQAAYLVIGKIRSDAKVKVVVKIDEDVTRTIAVEAQRLTQSQGLTNRETKPGVEPASGQTLSPQPSLAPHIAPSSRQKITKPVLALAAMTTLFAVLLVFWMLAT